MWDKYLQNFNLSHRIVHNIFYNIISFLSNVMIDDPNIRPLQEGILTPKIGYIHMCVCIYTKEWVINLAIHFVTFLLTFTHT